MLFVCIVVSLFFVSLFIFSFYKCDIVHTSWDSLGPHIPETRLVNNCKTIDIALRNGGIRIRISRMDVATVPYNKGAWEIIHESILDGYPYSFSTGSDKNHEFNILVIGWAWGAGSYQQNKSEDYSITFPLLLPAIIFGYLPLKRWQKYRLRRYRIKKGLCLKCGYDLRNTEDRCPECGTAK